METSGYSESLYLDGFGGLSEATIPLSRVSLFIGPQASGKSIAAKSIFFCKSYPREMLGAVYEELNREQFHSKLKKKFSEYFRSAAESKAFRVRYELDGEFVEIKAAASRKSNRHLELTTSEYFDREFGTLRKVYGKYRKRAEDSESEASLEYDFRVQESYSKRHEDRFGPAWPIPQVFIPAGRAYYSFLQASIFSLLSSNVPIDPFVREFGSSYERYKEFFFRKQPIQTGEGFKRHLEQVLRGSYVRRDKEDFIQTPDRRETLVSSSSSGQQEVLPLLVMLQYFFRMPPMRGRGVYIEEPEAHLFPDSQHKLVELLAYIFVSRSESSQLILTTHSPYVCSAANNLLLAGDLLERFPEIRKQLREVTTLGAYLNFDSLTALALGDGQAKSILNKEYRLIDTSYLDNVSSELINQREKLLDIESMVDHAS